MIKWKRAAAAAKTASWMRQAVTGPLQAKPAAAWESSKIRSAERMEIGVEAGMGGEK